MSEDHGQRLQVLEQNLQKMHEEQTAQMNRLLALDALLMRVFEQMSAAQIQTAAKRYEDQWMEVMARLAPPLQRPQLWQQQLQRLEGFVQDALDAERGAAQG